MLPRVRLLGASPADVEAVRRQVGPTDGTAEPGVVVRFADRLPSGSPAELCVDGPAEAWRVSCQRGLGRVPFLTEAVRMTSVDAGVLPLHAAAFAVGGAGVAVTGRSGSGKTGALLAFLFRGARHLAAEWVLVASDLALHGLPEPVRVRDWHLRELPGLWPRLPRKDRLRLRVLRAARAADGVVGGRVSAHLHADLEPERLPGSAGAAGYRLQRLFVMEAADTASPEVTPLERDEAAERVVAVLEHDLLGVRAEERRARARGQAAFEDRVDDVEERQRRLVRQRLAGQEILLVRHRHPGSLSALFGAMRPHVETRP